MFTTFSRDGRIMQLPVLQPPGKRHAPIRKATKRKLTKLLRAKADAVEFYRRFPELRGKHWVKIPAKTPERMRVLIRETGLFSRHQGWVLVLRGDQAVWVTQADEHGTWWIDGVRWTRGPNGEHCRVGSPAKAKPMSVRQRMELLADLLDAEDEGR